MDKRPAGYDEKAVEEAIVELECLGTLAAASVSRRTDRWPLFIDMCIALNRSGDEPKRKLAMDLAEGRFAFEDRSALARDCPGMFERLKALARLIGATVNGVKQPAESALDLSLLCDSIVEGQVPLLLAGAPSPVPLLLVLHQPGLPDGFAVADLYVWHVPVEGVWPEQLFVPAPASCLYEIEGRDRPNFNARTFWMALQRAGDAIRRRLSPEASPFALVWDLRPRGWGIKQPLCSLTGDSAGAAFAVAGLLALPREQVREDLRRHVQLICGPQVGVSAVLAPQGLQKADEPTDRLMAVGGIAHKLGILKEQEAAYAEVTRVYVGLGLDDTKEAWVAQPVPVAHLDALIVELASHTGGNLTDEQIALHEALLKLPDDDDGQDEAGAAEAAIDQDLLDKVANAVAQPPRSLRGYLLHRYAYWAQALRGRLHVNFVNLHLREAGAQVVRGGTDEPGGVGRQVLTSMQQVLDRAQGADALLLTGDPGCGKTTLLRRFEMKRARHSLRRLQQGAAPGPICVWAPLREYPHDLVTPDARAAAARTARSLDEQDRAMAQLTPMDWLASSCWKRQFGDMPIDLHGLAHRYGVQFLFDGLNEMQPPGEDKDDPDRRARALAGMRSTLVAGLRQFRLQGAAPIFSVRVLERGAGLGEQGMDGTFTVREVGVGDWTDEQMHRYLAKRLRPAAKARLAWDKIDANEGVKRFCARPMVLAGQCDLIEAGLLEPITDRARLFSALVWWRIGKRHEELSANGLLTVQEGVLSARIEKWSRPETMLTLPRKGILVPALDRQGDELRQRGGQVCPADDAGSWIKPPELRFAWLKAVQDLDLGYSDPYGDEWTFAHQWWQEFFAGRGLLGEHARTNPASLWPLLAAPRLTEDAVTAMARLGKRDPLPMPEVSALEESFKFAVQLAAEPAFWIGGLMKPLPGSGEAPPPRRVGRWAALADLMRGRSRSTAGRRAGQAFDRLNLALAGRAAAGCRERVPEALLAELRQALLERSTDPRTDLRLRVEAGLALGELGDTIRYADVPGKDGGIVRVPKPKHWVAVAGGRCTVGSKANDKEAFDNEKPLTEVTVSPFLMAWAPVTNAEFARFIEAGGYGRKAENERFWGSGDSLKWFRESDRRLPWSWNDSEFNNAAQPVAGVCLWEAQAYCRWLTRQIGDGRTYRLPTEAEWEFAARGHERHRYPWGDEAPTHERCNFDGTRLQRTSPVGAFPMGDRRLREGRLSDLAGNVWEWTCSKYTNRPERDALLTPASDADGNDVPRALRGGVFGLTARGVRGAFRVNLDPLGGLDYVGFRVVACPIEFPVP